MGKRISICLLVLFCFAAVSNAATNLLFNPGFETGDFDGWAEWGGVYIVTDAYEGTYAASLTDNGGMYHYNITLPAADDYTLAFWYKGDITSGKYNFGIESDAGDIVDETLTVTSEWKQMIVPFTLSEPAVANLWLWGNEGSATGSVIVDDFQLVRGDVGPTTEAMNPSPGDGQIAVEIDTDLSWTAGDDPNITDIYSFDVYVDPNMFKVKARSLDCLYVSLDRGPAATTYNPNPSGDNFVPDTTYYWCVDTLLQLDNAPVQVPVPGIVWSFSTSIPFDRPLVNAGKNLLGTTAMGLAGIQLNGEVTDPDDNLVTVLWSVIEQPDGSTCDITDTSDPQTTVTVDSPGLYVLMLFAEDAEEQKSRDYLEILLFDDPCEAAQSNPDGYTPIISDSNWNCKIGIEDLTPLALEWLKINYFAEYTAYEKDFPIIDNLLINPGFETGDETAWDLWGEDYLPTIDSKEQLSGSFCAYTSGTSGFAQAFYPKPGSTYEFTCNYKGTVADISAWWGFRTPDQTSYIVFGTELLKFTDEYKTVKEKHTILPDCQYTDFELWVWIMGGKNKGYFDDFQIVEVFEGAEPDITKAHYPQPEDIAEDVPIDNLTLSWETALTEDPQDPNFMIVNPDITAHYLYFSTDPNLPGSPIVELDSDVDPPDGNVDPNSFYTLTETLERDEVYYWRVDERLQNDANIIAGHVWSFTTENLGPQVDPGLNWVAWLDPDDAVVQPDATVTDPDDNLSSKLWSVYEKPFESTVLFSPDETVVDPIVTVDKAGKYLLKIWAEDDDGYTDEKLMAINVYDDACEAAHNHPDLVGILDGDLNSDCSVNIDDLLVLVADWLNFDYLIETREYNDNTYTIVTGYVVNGGFETGDLTGWLAYGSEITAENPFEGNYACAMGNSQGIFQDIFLNAGNYDFSFWTRGDIGTGVFYFGIEDADGEITGSSFDVTSEWTQFSYEFTVPRNEVVTFWYWGGNAGGVRGTCVVDEIWVEEQ